MCSQGITDSLQEIKIVKLKISSKGLDKSGNEIDIVNNANVQLRPYKNIGTL